MRPTAFSTSTGSPPSDRPEDRRFSLPGIGTDPPSVPVDDPAVLDAARAGDSTALETLLIGHYDRVHALCRRMLGNEADAVDAAQDALLSAVRSITRFDGRSSFGTWLYRIATNACLDELRRRRRRPVVGLPGEVDRHWDGADGSGSPGSGGDGGRFPPAFGPGPRDPADEATAHVDVDVALRTLAPEHRVAVVLRDLCDLTYDEIALILDVPIGTVRSRIARGRAALADLLTGAPGPDDLGPEDLGPGDLGAGDLGSGDLGSGAPPGPGEGNATGVPVVKPGKRTGRRAP